MTKNKLLLLLALLMTAATGAWADETYPIVYDFEAVANAGENPDNKNGSPANGQAFYGWENAEKTDTKRQDYKGYEYVTGSVLPKVCHVWRRSDRINGNVSNGGLQCPSDKQMAVDGLTEGLTVTIIYDATNASSKEIVWAIGDGSSESLSEPRAKAIINGAEAVPGTTTIKSGDVITVTKVTPVANGSGYIVFKVMKDMVIKKIIIDEAKAEASTYTVSLKSGVKDADKWTVKVGEGQAQALPIGGLKGDGSETVTLQYNGRLKVKGVTATSDAVPAAPTGNIVDLSTLTEAYEAQTLDILTGTTSQLITIADGATVTLKDATVNNQIACLGNATIILADGSTNTVTATSEKAAIKIGGPGTTLTITGSGSLTAQGGLEAAGIGTDRIENGELSFGNIVINGGTVTATGGNEGAGIGTGLAQGEFYTTSITCGDITINGGTVTATGGLYGAGIGTGPTMSDGGSASITCGDITINGGTVTATGGDYGPGIGTGVFLKYGGESASNRCGNITIGAGVTSVTATKGSSYSPNSIGKGYAYGGTQNFGTITIGGDATTYANGVTTSPFTYTPSN